MKQNSLHADDGLFFIDSSQKTPEAEIKDIIMAEVRRRGGRLGTRRVIENPIFVESHRWNLIQLADMIAYVVHRHYRKDSRFEGWFKSYRDDKEGTMAPKRHRREGWFMTTHLYQKDIREVAPDNNGVERVNRRFVAVRSDGGGNRTQRGMDANSVLFTVMATDWINGKSLYEHLMRSASGDG